MVLSLRCPTCGLESRLPAHAESPGVTCPRCQSYVPGPVADQVQAGPPTHPGPAPGYAPMRTQDFFFSVMGQGEVNEAAPAAVLAGSPGFARVPPGFPAGPADPPPAVFAPPSPVRSTLSPTAPPPPAPVPGVAGLSDADVPTLQGWLRDELQRFNSHVERQLASLQKQREGFTAWQSQVETNLVHREQELNRGRAVLAAKVHEIAGRERAVAEAEHHLEARDREHRAWAAQRAEKDRELDNHTREVDRLRGKADRLRTDIAVAQADLDALGTALKARREEAGRSDAQLTNRQRRLEYREAELAKSEAAVQRRLGELEDLEDQLRQEIEGRERELNLERQLFMEHFEVSLGFGREAG